MAFPNIVEKKLFEEKTTSLMRRKIRGGQVVVDVGSNIGYYTKLFSNLVGPNGLVFSFEPEPENFELLKRNCDLPNVCLEKLAVSNQNSRQALYLSRTSDGRHSLLSRMERKALKVKTVKLDSYFSDFKRSIDLVKIDVEGTEPFVLEGMKSSMKEKGPKIVIEFTNIDESGAKVQDLLDNLHELGYIPFFIKKSGNLETIREEKIAGVS